MKGHTTCQHHVRHTSAHWVSLATVSQAMGHSDVGVAANACTRVMEAVACGAAETVNASIFGTGPHRAALAGIEHC